jgi:hypothetical protein
VVDQSLVGRTLPPTAPYLVGREKVTEFALAIGEGDSVSVSYKQIPAHQTVIYLGCRLMLEK